MVADRRRPEAAPRPDPDPGRRRRRLRRPRGADADPGDRAALGRGRRRRAGPAQRGTTEARLGGSVNRMLLLAEDYPELRATENFQKLQTELSDVEEKISITRRVYNDTVETYNTKIQVFPSVLVANALRLRAARVLRGRRRRRDRADGRARRRRRHGAGMSGGRLIWGVIWRFAIAAIVFAVLAILPRSSSPRRAGREVLRDHRRQHARRAPGRRQPAGHREARASTTTAAASPAPTATSRCARAPRSRNVQRRRGRPAPTGPAATPSSAPSTGPARFGTTRHALTTTGSASSGTTTRPRTRRRSRSATTSTTPSPPTTT